MNGALTFPSALTTAPAVYRFWIETGTGQPAVYIGDTGDVRRRARQYRRGDGSQATSLWVHKHLMLALGQGAAVTFQLMTDARYSFDGSQWHETDLSLKEHRLVLENAALAEAFAEELGDDGHTERARVLNRFAPGRVSAEHRFHGPGEREHSAGKPPFTTLALVPLGLGINRLDGQLVDETESHARLDVLLAAPVLEPSIAVNDHQPMHSRPVRKLLRPLVAELRGLLGDDLAGLYLYGSAVTGDFDEGASDIDLVAVTRTEVTVLDTGGLERIHEAFVLGNPAWRDRLEIVYVARRTLANMAAGDSLAVISPGEPFHITGPAGDWLQNWYLLRETGVALTGPSPESVVAPIGTAEFLRGVKSYLGYLAAVEPSPYTVLSACRAARTLRTGHHCSKLAGAQWVSELMPEWSELIGSAVERRLARAYFDDPPTQHSARRLVELLATQLG